VVSLTIAQSKDLDLTSGRGSLQDDRMWDILIASVLPESWRSFWLTLLFPPGFEKPGYTYNIGRSPKLPSCADDLAFISGVYVEFEWGEMRKRGPTIRANSAQPWSDYTVEFRVLTGSFMATEPIKCTLVAEVHNSIGMPLLSRHFKKPA
jgi:hypothetical protein